jgi:hypothetical protein
VKNILEFLTFDHDLNMALSAKYFKVDVGERFNCEISKDDIKKIGRGLIIDWEADIKGQNLSVPNNPEIKEGWVNLHCRSLNFGIYCIFTVPTQHFYCKAEDVDYILGLAKYYRDLTNKTVGTFYSPLNEHAMDLAILDEFKHLKEVCLDLKIDIPYNLVELNEIKDYLEKNYYLSSGNYFYFVRDGAYMKHYYEYLLNIDNQ